jgi:hypothetical protein
MDSYVLIRMSKVFLFAGPIKELSYHEESQGVIKKNLVMKYLT